MTYTLNPEKIYADIINGKLNKPEAIEMLVSLIDESNDAQVRAECVEILERIASKTDRVFKTIENCLISDESPFVRSAAVKAIVQNYLKDDLSSLKWVIKNDKSPIVLKTIFDLFEKIDTQQIKLLKKELIKIIERFASVIGVIPEEVNFFLDLEALFAKDNKNYEIDLKAYKDYENLSNVKNGEPWLEIRNKRIVGLCLNFYNWRFIKNNPEYVDYLSNLMYLRLFLTSLKKLNINRDNIHQVPESIGSLTSLERLDLSRNNIQEVPESISMLSSLKTLNLSRNHIKNLPKSIGSLISLKSLDLSRNYLQNIPESIKNLESLTELRIDKNQIQTIPNSLKAFLNLLENFVD